MINQTCEEGRKENFKPFHMNKATENKRKKERKKTGSITEAVAEENKVKRIECCMNKMIASLLL